MSLLYTPWQPRRRSNRGRNTWAPRLRPRQGHASGAVHTGSPLRLPLVDEVVDVGRLRDVHEQLKREGGQAPGKDGIRYFDLGRSEAADILRRVSKQVLDGTYRPGPTRPVDIPKGNGGTRTLRIAMIIDRILAKSVQLAIDPFLERRYMPQSHGFRSGKGTWTMLADIDAMISVQRLTTLLNVDIAQAFDHVPLAQTFEYLRQVLGCNRLSDLVTTIVTGHDHARRKGINQGCPVSPGMLNLLLTFAHDRPLVLDQHFLSWRRYADDLVYACQDMSDAHQLRPRIVSLLEPLGLTLKAEKREGDSLVDLTKGGTTEILGFNVKHTGKGIRYSTNDKVLERLRTKLEEAHWASNPPITAASTVMGLLDQLGPALESDGNNHTLSRILHIARSCGYHEIGSASSLQSRWTASWQRWEKLAPSSSHQCTWSCGGGGVRRPRPDGHLMSRIGGGRGVPSASLVLQNTQGHIRGSYSETYWRN